MASMANSRRMCVITGRMPSSAVPRATPVIACSATGVSSTRIGPYFSASPFVEPKIAAASGAPSPMMNTRGSLAMQRSSASLSACTNFSVRTPARASGSGCIDVLRQLLARGERARAREGDRVVDLGGDRRRHGGQVRVAHEAPAPQPLGIELQWIARLPCGELAGRAIAEVLVVVGATVLEPPIGRQLEEHRTPPASRMLHRLAGQRMHDVGVVAVAMQGGHAMTSGQLGDLPAIRMAPAQWREDGIEIVLAHHHDGQPVDGGEVEALVE